MTLILDARKASPTSWPVGSHRADLERDLSAPADPADGGRHPLPALEAWLVTLGLWGITPDTHVVVTDDLQGGLAAARCWWMLRAVGHDRVRVAPLSELSVAMTDTPTHTTAVGPYPNPGGWQWPMADVEEVERRRADPTWRIVDARAEERFRGDTEPLDPVAGHIPGAVNVPWGETLELEVARERLQTALGDTPAERVIVHCGSGVTACHTLLQLDRLGTGTPALYVGSWSEWCRQSRPVGKGPS